MADPWRSADSDESGAPARPAGDRAAPLLPGAAAAAAGGRLGDLAGGSGDLVTGEAVVLDLRAASFASRMLGAVVDAVAVGLLLLLVLFGSQALAGDLDEAATAAVVLSEVVLCLVGVPVLVETVTRGRSLGKLVAGLRVVRDDGGPVRFRHALARALLGFFELWATLGSPAILCALVTARGKRFGDLLAGTFVVRERTAARHVPLPPMPQELAGWARQADIGRLPAPTAVAARQFLARAERLHPDSRRRLGADLAGALAAHVAPPPPAGAPAEAFVTAVLVERRDRELARMRAQRGRLEELSRTLSR
ncbi:RDD family protein [Kineococcus sp. SYSU DK004]|uniref:RDD family protein n=1 Tax=Kineococcus sp. SYSU DK004 TaxID=3383125 RepID=UPI003D7D5403